MTYRHATPADVPLENTPLPHRRTVEDARRWLIPRYDDWREASDDEMCEWVHQALDTVIPRGPLLWGHLLTRPDLGRLPGPGAVADTLEEVVRDVLEQACEPYLRRWAQAVYDRDHPDDEGVGG